jgi:hypothetical protein
VTVLATPEAAGAMAEQIRDHWPTVWFDLIVATRPEDVAAVLQTRAANGRRFG